MKDMAGFRNAQVFHFQRHPSYEKWCMQILCIPHKIMCVYRIILIVNILIIQLSLYATSQENIRLLPNMINMQGWQMY